MVNVYTDASVAHGKSVNTTFIIDDNCFLGCETFSHAPVSTSLEGELYGINDALDYIIKHYGDTNLPMVLWCDSDAAISYIDKQATEYTSIVNSIKSKMTKLDLELKLIRGHQVKKNPNKVVDILSNSILRLSSRG